MPFTNSLNIYYRCDYYTLTALINKRNDCSFISLWCLNKKKKKKIEPGLIWLKHGHTLGKHSNICGFGRRAPTGPAQRVLLNHGCSKTFILQRGNTTRNKTSSRCVFTWSARRLVFSLCLLMSRKNWFWLKAYWRTNHELLFYCVWRLLNVQETHDLLSPSRTTSVNWLYYFDLTTLLESWWWHPQFFGEVTRINVRYDGQIKFFQTIKNNSIPQESPPDPPWLSRDTSPKCSSYRPCICLWLISSSALRGSGIWRLRSTGRK